MESRGLQKRDKTAVRKENKEVDITLLLMKS